jgi:O-antigen/teichoic acid export membrane protein
MTPARRHSGAAPKISRGDIHSLVIAGLRSASIILRFALVFVIARELGVRAAGLYGVAQSLIGPAPAFLGLGLNYVLARELAVQPAERAIVRLRDRWVVSLAVCGAASVLFVTGCLVLEHPVSALELKIAALCAAEVLGADANMMLISIERAELSNLLIFGRTAAWIPIALFLALASPKEFSLDTVFDIWLLASCVSFAVLSHWMRKQSSSFLRSPVRIRYLFDGWHYRLHIYANEVANALFVNVDRYVAGALLGLQTAGIYAFYWSFSNAVYTVVSSSIMQVQLPKLVRAWQMDAREQWYSAGRRAFVRSAAASLVLVIAGVAAAGVAAHFSKRPELWEFLPKGAVLLGMQIVVVSSGVFNLMVYSSGSDRFVVTSNVAFSVFATALLFEGARAFGLNGLLGAFVFVTIALALARYAKVHDLRRRAC